MSQRYNDDNGYGRDNRGGYGRGGYDRGYDDDRYNQRDDRYRSRDRYDRYDDRDRYGQRDRYDDRDRYGYRDPRDRYDDRDRRRYDDRYDDRDRRRDMPPEPEEPDHVLYDWERKDYVPPPPVEKIDWDYHPAEAPKVEEKKMDRNVAVALKHRAVRPQASQMAELSDSFYKVNASDLLMMRKSSQYKGTFRKAGAMPRKIARCRFQFDCQFQDLTVDATFDINENSECLYNFLQGEVFTPDTAMRIFTPFPVVQIQNNNLKTLASFNVSGNILLSVKLGDHPILCPEMRKKYEELKAAEKAKQEEAQKEEKKDEEKKEDEAPKEESKKEEDTPKEEKKDDDQK